MQGTGKTETYAKSFSEATRKIAVTSFVSAILCILIYMSVLFVYRQAGNPKIIGYVEHVQVLDENGKVISDEIKDAYYFKEGEKAELPKADTTHYYDKLYTNDTFPEVLSQILMFAVSSVMIYNIAWGFGAYEKNAIAYGHSTRDKLKGVKLGLTSSFMFIVSYILLVFAKFGVNFKFAFPLFGLVNSTYLPLFNSLLNAKYGAYGLVGVLSFNIDSISITGIAIMLIPLIIKVLICYLGYELGIKQISIKDRIVFKK